jgi:hypothetical protein
MELVMTKAEKKHYDKLHSLGCIVCIRLGYGYSEPHIHHIRHGAGMGQKSVYTDAIPLCPNHHQNGGYGVALHAGQKEFEKKYGTEKDLLDFTNKIIGIIKWG